MLFETPYRQLVPFSPFDASLENANMIVAAASGSGKSVAIGNMLLMCGRQDVQVSIIERGDSYLPAVTYMGGQMISMSLDSTQTINPFDLEAGDVGPSNDHLAFLKNLTRFMIGDSGTTDTDLLDNLLLTAIKRQGSQQQSFARGLRKGCTPSSSTGKPRSTCRHPACCDQRCSRFSDAPARRGARMMRPSSHRLQIAGAMLVGSMLMTVQVCHAISLNPFDFIFQAIDSTTVGISAVLSLL